MFKRKVDNVLLKSFMNEKYYTYDKDFVYSNKKNFTEFLSRIEEEFYCHDFNRDDRYVCVGRHRNLIDEMQQLYYTKEQCEQLHLDKCPTIWCLDSLLEMIVNPNSCVNYHTLGESSNFYLDKSIDECRQIYDSYNADGIISLNERDYILHALNMIKDSLSKCDDNLEWI